MSFFLFIIVSQLILCIHSLELQSLDIPYPTRTYGGIGGIYENTMYGFNGINCKRNSIIHCNEFIEHHRFELNLSSLILNNDTNEITFISSPIWKESLIEETATTNTLHLGTGTSSSTIYNEYACILHPGCCNQPTEVAIVYNFKTNTYEDHERYNYIIPGESLSDSCNANDGIYLYTIGGRNGYLKTVSNAVYRYHIDNDEWEQVNHLNIARWGASCLFVDDALYVLGGSGESNTKLKTIEVFTETRINKNKWTISNAQLHTARNQHISVRHPNDVIVTIGGRNNGNNAAVVEIFDTLMEEVYATDIVYARKQFLHAVYELNDNTHILFVFGGNFAGIVYDDIQYMVMKESDVIAMFNLTTTTTTFPESITTSTTVVQSSSTEPTAAIETTKGTADMGGSFTSEPSKHSTVWIDGITTTPAFEEKEATINQWTMSHTLLVVLIGVSVVLLTFCIVLFIYVLIMKKKHKKRMQSPRRPSINSPRMKSPRLKSPRSPKIRFRDMSRVEGAPKLINQRKSSEGMYRKQAIDLDADNEINKLMIHNTIDSDTESEHDSSFEQMYILDAAVEEEEEQKMPPNGPKRTQTHSCSTMDGEDYDQWELEKDYDWIKRALIKCDRMKWNVYLKRFKKNKVTESRLIHLNEQNLMELIPESGVRAHFKQLWVDKQKQKSLMKSVNF